jgi:hypothetical protein
MDWQGTSDRGSSAPARTGPAIEQPALPAIEQEEHELAHLWLRFTEARGSLLPALAHHHQPMDGWLGLKGDPRPPFPVILVEVGADGVGVVLGLEHSLLPGQQGDLTTQAHGAGCQHRPVYCRQRQVCLRANTLQYAALSFRFSQPSPP